MRRIRIDLLVANMPFDEEDVVLLWWANRRRRNRVIKKKRRFWVHPSNQRNLQHSATVIGEELGQHPDKFQQFYRMNQENFCRLLALIRPLIEKKETHWRQPVPPEERLLITLR